MDGGEGGLSSSQKEGSVEGQAPAGRLGRHQSPGRVCKEREPARGLHYLSA